MRFFASLQRLVGKVRYGWERHSVGDCRLSGGTRDRLLHWPLGEICEGQLFQKAAGGNGPAPVFSDLAGSVYNPGRSGRQLLRLIDELISTRGDSEGIEVVPIGRWSKMRTRETQ